MAKVAAQPKRLPHSNVLRRWSTGIDLSRRPEDRWVIDFGLDISEADAALYEAPFEHILKSVKPARALVRREGHRKYWWRYGEPRPEEMRITLLNLTALLPRQRLPNIAYLFG